MNKKLSAVLIVFLFSLIIVIGCTQKDTGPGPISNTETATVTYTITDTPTSTPVLNTATVTASVTITTTPTATASPVTVADFENVNCYTSIVCSDCTNQMGGGISVNVDLYTRGCVALTGAPAELGSKAYSVSATALNDANKWFAIYVNTLSATGVGSDFSAYNRLSLAYKITTDAPAGDSIITNISMFTPDMSSSLYLTDVVLDRSGNWVSLPLDLSSFTVSSTTLTAGQILAQIGSIRIYFMDSGDGLSSPFTEIITDNFVFSAQ